jgi:hypothetical protein
MNGDSQMLDSTEGGDRRCPTELERAVEAELSRMDVHLAGIFAHGLQIQRDVRLPGMAVVLGSITREVSNGVIRHLAGSEGVDLTSEQLEELEQKREGNRASIATMLGLAVNHPSVDGWFYFNKSLHRMAHYRQGGIDPDAVLAGFDALKKFIFTQLGGYFDTRAEVDGLLVTPTPSEPALEALARLLSRSAQRRYFFGRLKQPGWAVPMLAAGFLPNAPEVPSVTAGEVRLAAWNEGEYLLQVAASSPDVVTAAVQAIPIGNQHPYVWRQVASIACSMPAPYPTRMEQPTLQREFWTGTPTPLGAGWRLHKSIFSSVGNCGLSSMVATSAGRRCAAVRMKCST